MNRREFGALMAAAQAVQPKTVVLTFDDAVKSHRTFVGPLLRELGFNATFFVTHRWMEDAEHFMSWQDIAELHQMGFEIGNHTWTHADLSTPRAASRLAAELALVDYELNRVKVPKPVSFAWPGNAFGPESHAVLRECGILYARRGGQPEVEYGKLQIGAAFNPLKHDALMIPTTGDAYPDWTFEHFQKVVNSGSVVVLQFHGVPDIAHPWVHTPADAFRRYMEYLKSNGFRTLALRDLAPYLGKPADPLVGKRSRVLKELPLPLEVVATQKELPYWRGVIAQHGYSAAEASLVTGLPEKAGELASGFRLLPYPGGRHMRIGFLEGAVNPMRGTKASVFLPWEKSGYLVVDLPEAVIANGKIHFLGHTHIPTKWDEKNVWIENRDWVRKADGSLSNEWLLPDQVAIGASIRLNQQAVEMECWIRNGSGEALKGIRAQVCVMFRGAPAFAAQTNDNKKLESPQAEIAVGGRKIVTEWEDCQRVWGNARCPCMHSDPKFPDCAPGETVRRTGRLWFG
jgi:peptidoglycan/xylan/chitin deacetylase (PgdA/CDA1 family)